MHKAEWRTRADFAEYAEALGVPTSQVAIVQLLPYERLIVIWTDNPAFSLQHGDRDAIGTLFQRDDHGLLLKLSQTKLPGFFSAIGDALTEIDWEGSR
jgi:hypothetical protein